METNMNIPSAKASLFALSLGMATATACAQPSAQPAPGPAAAKYPLGAYANFGYHAGLTCGAGSSTSQVSTKPTVQCGGLITIMPFPLPLDLEVGVMGPQANRSPVSGYLSANLTAPLIPPAKPGNTLGIPLIVGGYTRMFETGHAVDYGVAFAHPIDNTHSIQFEARDYWAFANPSQHNIVFRVAWLVGLPD